VLVLDLSVGPGNKTLKSFVVFAGRAGRETDDEFVVKLSLNLKVDMNRNI